MYPFIRISLARDSLGGRFSLSRVGGPSGGVRPTRGADKEDRRVMHMMDGSCGVVMAVIAGLGGLLGFGLVGSLIVLIWVVIGRLRRAAVSG